MKGTPEKPHYKLCTMDQLKCVNNLWQEHHFGFSDYGIPSTTTLESKFHAGWRPGQSKLWQRRKAILDRVQKYVDDNMSFEMAIAKVEMERGPMGMNKYAEFLIGNVKQSMGEGVGQNTRQSRLPKKTTSKPKNALKSASNKTIAGNDKSAASSMTIPSSVSHNVPGNSKTLTSLAAVSIRVSPSQTIPPDQSRSSPKSPSRIPVPSLTDQSLSTPPSTQSSSQIPTLSSAGHSPLTATPIPSIRRNNDTNFETLKRLRLNNSGK